MLDLETMRLIVGLALAAIAVACTPQVSGGSGDHVVSKSQPIIHGTVSTPDQNFVVQLAVVSNGQNFGSCSASVVAKNLLLTARHCVGRIDESTQTWTVTDYGPQFLWAYYGADAPVRSAALAEPNARGARLFVPPTNQMLPDVALVLLDRPITAAPIARIRLDGGARKGELVDVVGFGIDETSREPSVRMQRRGVPVLAVGPGVSAQHEQIFDGEFIFGEAACSGDSGGPALSATTRAIVGVASRVGNGLAPTDDNAAAFCVGAATEDVYTALAPVKDIVLRAFQAAGATPLLENDPEPAPPPAGSSADPKAETPAADDDADGVDAVGSKRRTGSNDDDEDDDDTSRSSGAARMSPPPASQGCSVGSVGDRHDSLLGWLLLALCAGRRAASKRAR